jgi:hypothetical protein
MFCLRVWHVVCNAVAAQSAARDAQKAIALDSDCLEAYLIRADALHYMGQVMTPRDPQPDGRADPRLR